MYNYMASVYFSLNECPFCAFVVAMYVKLQHEQLAEGVHL